MDVVYRGYRFGLWIEESVVDALLPIRFQFGFLPVALLVAVTNTTFSHFFQRLASMMLCNSHFLGVAATVTSYLVRVSQKVS